MVLENGLIQASYLLFLPSISEPSAAAASSAVLLNMKLGIFSRDLLAGSETDEKSQNAFSILILWLGGVCFEIVFHTMVLASSLDLLAVDRKFSHAHNTRPSWKGIWGSLKFVFYTG